MELEQKMRSASPGQIGFNHCIKRRGKCLSKEGGTQFAACPSNRSEEDYLRLTLDLFELGTYSNWVAR